MEFQVVRTGKEKDGRNLCFKPTAFCRSRYVCRLNLLHLSIKINFFYREVGSDTLCRPNFEHNTMDGASSIMPA